MHILGALVRNARRARILQSRRRAICGDTARDARNRRLGYAAAERTQVFREAGFAILDYRRELLGVWAARVGRALVARRIRFADLAARLLYRPTLSRGARRRDDRRAIGEHLSILRVQPNTYPGHGADLFFDACLERVYRLPGQARHTHATTQLRGPDLGCDGAGRVEQGPGRRRVAGVSVGGVYLGPARLEIARPIALGLGLTGISAGSGAVVRRGATAQSGILSVLFCPRTLRPLCAQRTSSAWGLVLLCGCSIDWIVALVLGIP